MSTAFIVNFLFIVWNQNPEIWPGGSVPFRWYGLLFALGFFIGQIIITKIFKAEGKPEKDVDALTYYMIIATILGARLGHCLFYQPDFYLANPIEILKVWEGGLASHGATVGIIFAMWLYTRKRPDQSWLWILDRIVIVVALGGAFIRFGNLMNSEIIGKPSSLPWAMVFAHQTTESIQIADNEQIEKIAVEKMSGDTLVNELKMQSIRFHITFKKEGTSAPSIQAFVLSALPIAIQRANEDEENVVYYPQSAQIRHGFDSEGRNTLSIKAFGIPRHPSMMYESISTLFIFLVLFFYWKRNVGKLPEGQLFSIFVIILFTLRFFYEFSKENQVDFEAGLPLNMGQILSIPMVAIGIFIFFKSLKKNAEKASNSSS